MLQVFDIFFGEEDAPDARFVALEDCGHIIEVNGLDHYMSMPPAGGEIVLNCCPKCKTPIRKNLRYSNQVKTILNDIERVKVCVINMIKKVPMFFC